jgi:tetratricopeptide (TPR) repeat protein
VKGLEQIRSAARQAVAARDWRQVTACALELKHRAPREAESPFLLGLAQKATGQRQSAADLFKAALELDGSRYDAAIELAYQDILLNRHAEARDLLDRYRSRIRSNAHYLDLAAQGYSMMSMHEEAWPLYEKARRLQPQKEIFQAHLAACAVYLGKIDIARSIYQYLLTKRPDHQRNHYELAQLSRATDDRHLKQMMAVLERADPDPARNIFLYYAIGKELEDLGRWEEAFDFYKRGGDAARSRMDYDVARDVATLDKVIAVCNAAWLTDEPVEKSSSPTPVFVVGLPRTGTTLVERILSSHSKVESAGETHFMHMAVRRESGVAKGGELTPEVVEAAAARPAGVIAAAYIDAISYRLRGSPFFIEKLPENVLHLGFIAKGWPDARIVHLRRHPMDACFAMYKQSYFRFAYTLDDLAEYYLAYDRLTRHWRELLGDRVVEVQYETLVVNQEAETRRILDGLGLPFEDACVHFERNASAVATASSVQVREKAHTRSVGRWKKFAHQLEPLRERLQSEGVSFSEVRSGE